uniref:VP1 protein n=1 Tax=Cryptocentrus strigilliceps parvovirus TaxID=3156501 RepID=A0AAU7BB06_9VIRU
MGDTITFKHLKCIYVDNSPYVYPNVEASELPATINTGWQVLPNQLLGHLISPLQWDILKQKSSSFGIRSIKQTLFNMIPLTETVAIQGNATFTAFNNTIFLEGYADKHYETAWFDWSATINNFLPFYKEGVTYEAGAAAAMDLPKYIAPRSVGATSRRNRMFNIWDPMVSYDDLMELRPGKNAISFNWVAADCDHKMYNMDARYFTQPNSVCLNGTQGTMRKKGLSVDVPSLMQQQLASKHAGNSQFWFRAKIARDNVGAADPNFWLKMPLTVHEGTMYPPHQWFVKLIPLFDAANALIQTRAMVMLMTETTFAYSHSGTSMFSGTYSQVSDNYDEMLTASGMDMRANQMRARSTGLMLPIRADDVNVQNYTRKDGDDDFDIVDQSCTDLE